MYLENDREGRCAELMEHILGLGYRLYWHLPSLFNDENYFEDKENIFDRIVSVNMLGVSSQDSFDTGGLTEITDPSSTWQDAH